MQVTAIEREAERARKELERLQREAERARRELEWAQKEAERLRAQTAAARSRASPPVEEPAPESLPGHEHPTLTLNAIQDEAPSSLREPEHPTLVFEAQRPDHKTLVMEPQAPTSQPDDDDDEQTGRHDTLELAPEARKDRDPGASAPAASSGPVAGFLVKQRGPARSAPDAPPDLGADETAVLLSFDEDRSLDEISEATGLPSQRVHQIMRKLRHLGVLENAAQRKAATAVEDEDVLPLHLDLDAPTDTDLSLPDFDELRRLADGNADDSTRELPAAELGDDDDELERMETGEMRRVGERKRPVAKRRPEDDALRPLKPELERQDEDEDDSEREDEDGDDGAESDAKEPRSKAADKSSTKDEESGENKAGDGEESSDEDAPSDGESDDEAESDDDDKRTKDSAKEGEADDGRNTSATIDEEKNYKKLFESELHPMPTDQRVDLAGKAEEPFLSAFCYDPNARVIKALMQNTGVGLRHSRLVAFHHRTSQGLEAVASRADFGRDGITQRKLTHNPMLPESLLRKILMSKPLRDVYKFTLDRDVPERSRASSRAIFRRKFTQAQPEERVGLIWNTEGRALSSLTGTTIDSKTASLLCARQINSVMMIQSFARFPATPPSILSHLLRSPLVKRQQHLKRLLLQHPNVPSDLKRRA